MRDPLFLTKLRVFLYGWRWRHTRRRASMRARLRALRRRLRRFPDHSSLFSRRSSVGAHRSAFSVPRSPLPTRHASPVTSQFFLETLEPRLLMAADLAGVVQAHTLADVSVPTNAESATVRVTNQGNQRTDAVSQVAVYASLDTTFDASDILLGTANAPRRINAGAATNVVVPLSMPGTLQPVTYNLLTRVDATNVIAEGTAGEANNLRVGPQFEVEWQFGAVPGRTGNTTLTILDTDGTQVTFSLAGPGTGEVIRDGAKWDVRITGTTSASAVTILTNSAGNGRVTIDDIHVQGPLAALTAATADITGTVAIDGPVVALTLGSVNGGVVAAPSITALTIGIPFLAPGHLTNATILIGATLGQDGKLGGTGLNADTFGQGRLGSLVVSGAMTNSTLRVGVDPVDGTFGNGDDVIRGGASSSITVIAITGQMSSTSRVIAGALPALALVNGTLVNTATDPRFSTDITAPALTAGLVQDTGNLPTDGLTNNPAISGSLTDAGGIATFTAGFGATPTVNVLGDRQPDGSFAFSRARLEQINGGPLADGTYVLKLQATDTKGNSTQLNVPFSLDTQVLASTFDLAAGSDTAPVGDQQTTEAVVTLAGQTEALASLLLLETGAITQADASGNFSFTNVALALGTNSFTVRATDQAGNQRTTSRTITRLLTDSDGDGIPDASEGGGPNSGDANNDGIPDSQQANVASLQNAIDNQYVTLVAPTGTQLVNVQAGAVAPGAPAGVEFPFGQVSYEIYGVTPGGSIQVTMLLPTGSLVNSFYKYGPEPLPGNTAAHWYDFALDVGTGTGATISGDTITLSFIDGGRGDADLAPNGIIVDPGAPVVTTNRSPVITALLNQSGAAITGPIQVSEGGIVSFTVQATDPDTPTQLLTFGLENGPRGAFINPSTGSFTWSPGQDAGPATFTFNVVASDDGTPSRSGRRSVQVTVLEDAAFFFQGLGGVSSESATAGFLSQASVATPLGSLQQPVNIVVGDSISPTGTQAFWWNQDGPGMIGLQSIFLPSGYRLSSSHATAVTSDGMHVVGNFVATSDNPALPPIRGVFQWDRPSSQNTVAGRLSGNSDTQVFDISDNGTIVGMVTLPDGTTQAFRSGGTAGFSLGDLPGGPSSSIAYATNYDSSIVVGQGTSGLGPEAVRWTAEGILGLGDLPGGEFRSVALGTSSSGNVIVGQAISAEGPEAVRWIFASGTGPFAIERLGDLPGGEFNSIARAISAFEALIVGQASVDGIYGKAAFIWDPVNGMRNLQETLIQLGFGDELAGWTLLDATDVSPGVRTIVGSGINPLGQIEAWRLRVKSNDFAPTLEAIPNQAVNVGETVTFTPVASDLDVGQHLTWSLLNAPAGATFNPSTGAFSWTPSIGQAGVTQLTIRVSDNGIPARSAEQTVTITVNQPSIAVDDLVMTPEDVSLSIAWQTLLANDTDPENGHVTVVKQSDPAHGTLVSSAGNTFTYTPNLNFHGTDSFTYVVNDGLAISNVATVTITITSVNDVPVANAKDVVTEEDTTKTITLTASDPDGDALTYSIIAEPRYGTLSGTGANRIYTPAQDYFGTDSFAFTVNDGQADSNVATVALIVTPVNDAPVANNQSVTTAEDTAKTITLTGSDADATDRLGFDIVDQPVHGTLIGTGLNRSYLPAANYYGPDSFTFKINDGQVDSNVATVTIDVTPVPDTVTWTGAAGDELWSTAGNWDLGRTPEADDNVVIDASDIAIELGAGVTSIGSLTVGLGNLELTSAAGGTLVVDGLAAVHTLEIREAAFRAGALQGDALGLSRNAQVTVMGATNLTTLVQYRGSTAIFDGVTEIASVRVGGLAGSGGSPPQLFPGTSDVVQFNGATQIQGTLLLFAQGTLMGIGDVVLTGTQLDWLGGTMSGSGRTIVELGRTLEVSSASPVRLDRTLENRGTVMVRAGTEVTGTGNYEQAAPVGRLQIEIGGPTTFGRLALSGAVSLAGGLEVTLLNGFVPSDGTRFQFLTNGTRTGSFTTTSLPLGLTLDTTDPTDLEVVAIASNQAPVAGDDGLTTVEDKPLTITGSALLANDTDPDGDPLQVYAGGLLGVGTGPAHGSLTVSADATALVYTPATDFVGTDSFTYAVSDGDAFSNLATVTITVTANHPPVAGDDVLTTPPNTPLTIVPGALVANDSDPDGDALQVLWNQPRYGSLILNETATALIYTPATDFAGTDRFTYRVTDFQAESNLATVTIVVPGPNTVPVGGADSYQMVQGTTLTVAAPGVLANDTDANGDVLTAFQPRFVAPDGSDGGPVPTTQGVAFTLLPDGSFTYAPPADFVGTDSFVYTVTDGQTGTTNVPVTITVTRLNRAPVAGDDVLTTRIDRPLTIPAATLLANDSDPDGDSLQIQQQSLPTHGSVTVNADGTGFLYTPAAGFVGTDSFTYRLTDGLTNVFGTVAVTVAQPVVPKFRFEDVVTVVEGDSGSTAALMTLLLSEATTVPVTVEVRTADSFPLAEAGTDYTALVTTVTFAPGETSKTLTVDVLGDTVAEEDEEIFVKATNLTNATFDTFTSGGTTIVQDHTFITIQNDDGAQNHAPVADDQSVTTPEDMAVAITLTGSDADVADRLGFTIVDQPLHGTLTGSNANLIYVPTGNYVGPDIFTFKINDGQLDSNLATVSLTVTPVNDVPVAIDQSVTTAEDKAVTITLTGSDIDNDPLTYSIVTGPQHGTLTGTGATRTYTPAANYAGPDSFTFEVNDGTVDSNVATVTITVTPAVAGAHWINPAGGDWNDPTNWSTGAVPTVADDVFIDLPGNFTVTYSAGFSQVKSLVSNHSINLTGGTLAIGATVTTTNPDGTTSTTIYLGIVQMNEGAAIILAGGRLQNAFVYGAGVGPDHEVIQVSGVGTLENVELGGVLDPSSISVPSGGELHIVNFLNLFGPPYYVATPLLNITGGTVIVDGGGSVVAVGGGAIKLSSGGALRASSGGVLQLGTSGGAVDGLVILAEHGTIGSADSTTYAFESTSINVAGNGNLDVVNFDNSGDVKIDGSAAGGGVGALNGTGYVRNASTGTIRTLTGSVMTLNDFVNNGTFIVDGLSGTVTLTMTGASPFDNRGSIETLGNPTLVINGSLLNSSTGRVFIGQDVSPTGQGTIQVSDNVFNSQDATIALRDGVLTVGGVLHNEGIINLDTGLAQVTSNYDQTDTGTLTTILASLTDFGRLEIGEGAVLSGTLALASGGTFNAGDRYQFMTFAFGRDGYFTSVQFPLGLTVDDTDPNDLEVVIG